MRNCAFGCPINTFGHDDKRNLDQVEKVHGRKDFVKLKQAKQ